MYITNQIIYITNLCVTSYIYIYNYRRDEDGALTTIKDGGRLDVYYYPSETPIPTK